MAIDFTGVNFGQEKDDEIDFSGVDFSGVDFGESNEGSVGMDLAASFGKGSNLLLKSIGDVYGLASGNMDNWASRQGQSGVEYYEDLQSDELRRLQQDRSEAVGQADGFWDEAGTAVWETVKNPRLFATFLTEQIPMTIGPGAAGRVASGVSKAAGVGTAVGTGAALQGGSVGDEVYDNIVNMPEEVWQKNDDYQALLSEMAPEEAKESLALKYARGAATASGALSVGSQMVPGGIAIERVLSKGKGALPGGLLARVGKGFAGETAQEALEEGGGQFVGNVAERSVDPTQDLMEGVGESAGLGALGGGPFGALAGIPGGDRQQTLDNIEQEVTEKTGNPVDGAIARAEADLDLDTTDINSYINDELVEADRDTSGDIGAVFVGPEQPFNAGPPRPAVEGEYQSAEALEQMRRRAAQEVRNPGGLLGQLSGNQLPPSDVVYGQPPEGMAERRQQAQEATRNAFEGEFPAPNNARADARLEAEARRKEYSRLANVEIANEDADTPALDAARNQGLDGRWALPEYRQSVEEKAGQLVEKGGVNYLFDDNGRIDGRTASQNPEWFQNAVGELGSVADVRKAVTKALNGEKLGVRQARAVSALMDAVDDERIQVNGVDEFYNLESLDKEATFLASVDPTDETPLDSWVPNELIGTEASPELRPLATVWDMAQSMGVPETELLDAAARAVSAEELTSYVYQRFQEEYRNTYPAAERDTSRREEGRREPDAPAPRESETDIGQPVLESRDGPTLGDAYRQDILSTYTEAGLAARAQQEETRQAATQAESQQAEQRAKADVEANDFRLSGSDSAADIAVAGGQTDLLGAQQKDPAQDIDDRMGKAFNAEGKALISEMQKLRKEYPDQAGRIDERFEEMAPFIEDDESADPVVKAMAQSTMRRVRGDDEKAAIKSEKGDDLTGVELGSNDGKRFAILSPDASNPGKVRATFFSESGFTNHTTYDNYDKALDEAFEDGYRNRVDGKLDELSTTERFKDGNEYVAKIQAVNSGQKTMDEAFNRESPKAKTSSPTVRVNGQPFATEKSALASAKQKGVENAKAVQVDGGWGYATETVDGPSGGTGRDTVLPSEPNDIEAGREGAVGLGAGVRPSADGAGEAARGGVDDTAADDGAGDADAALSAADQQFNFSAVIRDKNGNPFHVNSRRGRRANVAPFNGERFEINSDNPTVDLDDYTFDNEWYEDGEITQKSPEAEVDDFSEATAFGSRALTPGEIKFVARHLGLDDVSRGPRTEIVKRGQKAGLIGENGELLVRNLTSGQRKQLRSAVRQLPAEQAAYESLISVFDASFDVTPEPEKTGLRLVVDNTPSVSAPSNSAPVLTKSGKPFKGKGSATLAAKRAGIADPEIVEVDGGFGYRAADSSPATESEADTARNTSTPVEAYGDESLDLRRRQDMGSSLERELTDDDIASQPLSKIWPKQEVDAIEDTDAAAFATAVRDSIPAKPRKSSRKARWVEEVKAAREVMRHYQNNPEKVLELAKGSRALRGMLDRVEVLKSLDRSEWSRVGSVRTHPTAHTYSKSGEKVPAPQVSVEIDGRGHTVRGAKTAAEAIDSIKEKLASSDPKATSGMKFTVRGRPGRYFIHKDGDSERRPLATFDTTEAAFDYRKNNYDDLVKAWDEVKERDNVKKTDVRSKENRDRTGADYRQGRDISPQEFVEQFGLRHVDFGKWVKDGDGERQRLLNQTYDALMDLSNIVGIPPSAIGLEGNLIFTFGKRGSGSASAHFEAGTNKVINLTKTKGAGSLGHEWFHALDNYFQEKRGPHGADRENAFITYAPENFYRDEKTGQRIPEREFDVMAEGGVSERGRRFVMSRFDRDSWELVEGVRPEVAIKFAELVEALDKSPMKDRASVIDKGRSDGYWSRVLERAARSFENYLIAKMEENGYNNDFLANVVSPDRFARNPERYPYLLPEETAPVSDAFDSLFETIESDSDSGMLYSREAYVPADAKPKGVGKGTAQLAVNKFLKQYKGADDVNVVVARNYEEHFGQKPKFRTKGGYSPKTDTLYLFTDELDSVAELGETLRHEILVHKGLGMVEPAQLKQLLDTFYASAKDSPELAQIVGEVQRVEKGRSDRVKAEEILARIGQEKLSFPDKVLNKLFLAIQRMLNSVGLGKVSARRQGKDLVYRIADAFAEGKRARRRVDLDGVMNQAVAEDNGPGTTAWERAKAKGLDMSKEARMERARDMGFDTDNIYQHHTGGSGFSEFEPSRRGENTLGNASSPGLALTSLVGDFFNAGGDFSSAPYGSSFDVFLPGGSDLYDIGSLGDFAYDMERHALEVMGIDRDTLDFPDDYGQDYLPIAKSYAEELAEQGYKGVRFIDEEFGGESVAIFDPKNIRSVNAAFDPDQADSPNLMFSRTDDTFTPPVEERMASRWVRNRDWFIRKFQNKFIPVQRLEEAIKESGGNVSERDSVVMAEEAFYGKTENDLKTLEKRLVDPLIAAMNENDVSQEELDLFLIANHAKERNAYIASINDDLPDGGSGMTDDESDAVMRRFREEGKLDAVKAVAEKVYKITETRRRILEDAGLVDADYLAQFETPYENYVPLKGFAENESEGRAKVGRGFDIRGKEDMRAMGRRTMAESPTLHAIQDLTASAIRLRKNEVGQTFLRMVEANPNPEYWEVFTEDNPDTRRTMVNGRVKEQPISNMGMLKDDYFAVKRDGQEYFIKVKDKRVQDALQNVGPEQLGAFVRAAGKVTRFLSAVNTSYNPEFMISNMSRDIQTAVYNALAENEIEDGKIKGAGKSLSTRMVKGVPNAMRAIWGESRDKAGDSEYRRYYKEFLADGAKTGYFDSKDIDGLAKELQNKLSMAKGTPVGMAKRGIKAVGDFVEDMNSAVENAVRLSGYIEARKAGVSRKKAASFAKSMTINFNAKGEAGSAMNAAFLFFNAAIQGNKNFLRAIGHMADSEQGRALSNAYTGKKLNAAQKAAGVMMGAGIALSLLNREMAGEDDDGENWYDKVPDYVRERNIVLMKSLFGGPEGEYYTIPLPYGYNIFYNLGDTMEGAMNGSKKRKEGLGLNLALSAINSFSPFGYHGGENAAEQIGLTFTPTIAQPLVEIIANTNHFGGDIYRENYAFGPQKADAELSFRSTKQIYKNVAEFMNRVSGGSTYESGAIDVSPDTLEHIAEFALGGIYRLGDRTLESIDATVDGRELDVGNIPFRRKVEGDVTPYDDISDFYDARQEIVNLREEAKLRKGRDRAEFLRDNRQKLQLKGMVDSTYERLRDLNKRRDRIEENESLTDAQRDERLRAIERMKKKAVDRFNKRWNEAA